MTTAMQDMITHLDGLIKASEELAIKYKDSSMAVSNMDANIKLLNGIKEVAEVLMEKEIKVIGDAFEAGGKYAVDNHFYNSGYSLKITQPDKEQYLNNLLK